MANTYVGIILQMNALEVSSFDAQGTIDLIISSLQSFSIIIMGTWFISVLGGYVLLLFGVPMVKCFGDIVVGRVGLKLLNTEDLLELIITGDYVINFIWGS